MLFVSVKEEGAVFSSHSFFFLSGQFPEVDVLTLSFPNETKLLEKLSHLSRLSSSSALSLLLQFFTQLQGIQSLNSDEVVVLGICCKVSRFPVCHFSESRVLV